jgi:hypothetical protein
MSIRKREGNRPDRRIAPADFMSEVERQALAARIRYTGSGLHKLRPGDYGFVPSHNPRPSKSACDDLRTIPLDEARTLFALAIELGMVSRFGAGQLPKYIWAVGEDDEVYEAKTNRATDYHGYRLGDDEREMRRLVRAEWRRRWRAG